ncbi:hypothetical protein GCM10011579_043310 [Streptomyces albiflavescens]|uniref:Uncharacterized protein n=1 Tax=Streptomyces albiflavescens TaxID=1623582 RepID=A0A918D5N0_9ACTN|nr:hypothetical protein GCM10011579_043310 [Streptomyces albiflavescens]
MPSAAPIPAAAPAATTARRVGTNESGGRVCEGMAEGCKALLLGTAFRVVSLRREGRTCPWTKEGEELD